MEHALERNLVAIAQWGPWLAGALLIFCLFALRRLGRRGLSVLPLLGALLSLAALGLMLGPMRPMLAEVRRLHSLVGTEARDVAFVRVADGSPRRLSELRGKVVLVNVWATWCMPCRHEMPELDRLQRDLEGRGLVVMTASNESLDTLRKYETENHPATLGVAAPTLGWMDAPGRPLSFVIDRQGRVRDLMIGGQTYDRFERAVRPYLG
jgi:thiol-disulfide isomerase/thioredoxin